MARPSGGNTAVDRKRRCRSDGSNIARRSCRIRLSAGTRARCPRIGRSSRFRSSSCDRLGRYFPRRDNRQPRIRTYRCCNCSSNSRSLQRSSGPPKRNPRSLRTFRFCKRGCNSRPRAGRIRRAHCNKLRSSRRPAPPARCPRSFRRNKRPRPDCKTIPPARTPLHRLPPHPSRPRRRQLHRFPRRSSRFPLTPRSRPRLLFRRCPSCRRFHYPRRTRSRPTLPLPAIPRSG